MKQPDKYKFLTDYANELASVFVVSYFKVEYVKDYPACAEKEVLLEAEGARVFVEKARGEKCERCWNYFESVNPQPCQAKLCQRCLGVLKENKV